MTGGAELIEGLFGVVLLLLGVAAAAVLLWVLLGVALLGLLLWFLKTDDR